jgi:hypothetical protein
LIPMNYDISSFVRVWLFSANHRFVDIWFLASDNRF